MRRFADDLKIRFRTRRLQKQYENIRDAEKAYGKDVVRKYILRVDIIKQAKDVDELKALPALRCHQLKGKRQGQWSINITGFYRLIFILEGDHLEIARLEEVSKHYDD